MTKAGRSLKDVVVENGFLSLDEKYIYVVTEWNDIVLLWTSFNVDTYERGTGKLLSKEEIKLRDERAEEKIEEDIDYYPVSFDADYLLGFGLGEIVYRFADPEEVKRLKESKLTQELSKVRTTYIRKD